MIGVGIDLVEVDRMRTALDRTPSLVGRMFTERERADAEAARDPAERFATRFAAKEAVMKVLGVGLGAIGWHDAEVIRAESGAPSLVVTGRAAVLADAAGITAWKISLTHTHQSAEAIVIAL